MQIEAYTIAVLGAGTMGEGIAQIAGTAGHPVLLYDVSQAQTQSAIENIDKRLQRTVHKEKITDKKRTQILTNIKPVQTLEELAKAKLAIEAIFEDSGSFLRGVGVPFLLFLHWFWYFFSRVPQPCASTAS